MCLKAKPKDKVGVSKKTYYYIICDRSPITNMKYKVNSK